MTGQPADQYGDQLNGNGGTNYNASSQSANNAKQKKGPGSSVRSSVFGPKLNNNWRKKPIAKNYRS